MQHNAYTGSVLLHGLPYALRGDDGSLRVEK